MATDERPPILQAPVYLMGAEPPKWLQDALAKKGPGLAGLVGATALGVTAAYFAPKFFDWVLQRRDDGETVELDSDG